MAGQRPSVVTTMDEQSLRERAEQAGLLPHGALVSAGELRRLLCDAQLTPVVLGTASEPLDVGRTHRLVTPAIRKAVTLRDGGCIFPNCHQPQTRCEAHHVIPWWAGGPTSTENLVLLCPHHHAVVEPDRFNPRADQWRVEFHPKTRKPTVRPPQRAPSPSLRC